LIHREKLGPIALRLATWAGKIRRKKPNLLKTEASVRHLLESWDALVQGGWPRPVLGSVLNTSFDMLSLGSLFAATGHRVGAEVLIAGYGAPQLLGKLTVVLGGVGIVETSMVALYAILGFPKTAAVTVVLGYRLVSFWLPTIGGIALVPFLEHWKERPIKA
jgi:glycosyltransferase 2 family protein